MTNSVIGKMGLVSVAVAALCGPGQLLAQGCAEEELQVAVYGKIFNNAQAGGAFGTLGVVALRGDYPVGKMKCGIVGVAATPTNPQLPLAFTHTISCDDKVELPIPGNPVVHSQIAFDTQGYFHDDFAYCNGTDPSGGISTSFTEFSTPRAGEGRGVFTTATGGQLVIEGTISCFGTIDMTFTGDICMTQPAY